MSDPRKAALDELARLSQELGLYTDGDEHCHLCGVLLTDEVFDDAGDSAPEARIGRWGYCKHNNCGWPLWRDQDGKIWNDDDPPSDGYEQEI